MISANPDDDFMSDSEIAFRRLKRDFDRKVADFNQLKNYVELLEHEIVRLKDRVRWNEITRP